LYDRINDPNELTNIAYNSNMANIKNNLKNRLIAVTEIQDWNLPSHNQALFFGDFERAYYGWEKESNTTTYGNFEIVYSNIPSGAAAAKINATALWTCSDNSCMDLNNFNIKLVKDSTYTLSYWLKSNTLNAGFKTLIETDYPDFTNISNQTFLDQSISANTYWTKYYHTFIAPQSSRTYLSLNFSPQDHASYVIDAVDLKIHASNTFPIFPEICNNSFEADLNFWNYWILDGASANFSIDTSEALFGEKCLKIEQFIPGLYPWSTQFVSCNTNTEEGKIYKVAFWAKAANSSNIKMVAGSSVSPYLQEKIMTFNLLPAWQNYNFVFQADNTWINNLQIKFQVLGADSYFIDHVEIEELATFP